VYTGQWERSGLLHSKLQLATDSENDKKKYPAQHQKQQRQTTNTYHITNRNNRKRKPTRRVSLRTSSTWSSCPKYATTRASTRSCKTVRFTPADDNILTYIYVNLLTPNDDYSGRTAPLTSKCCILYVYSTNIDIEYFKHGTYSPIFPRQNAVCSINLTYLVLILFTFYIQNVLKLKKIIPASKG